MPLIYILFFFFASRFCRIYYESLFSRAPLFSSLSPSHNNKTVTTNWRKSRRMSKVPTARALMTNTKKKGFNKHLHVFFFIFFFTLATRKGITLHSTRKRKKKYFFFAFLVVLADLQPPLLFIPVVVVNNSIKKQSQKKRYLFKNISFQHRRRWRETE